MFKGCEDAIMALARLSTMVNGTLDLAEVLDNAMKSVEELMDAEATSIFEVDYERDELFFRLARGNYGNKAREIRLSMGEGIAGWVALNGRPLLVPDVNKDKRFSSRTDEYTGFKTRSMACVPIRHKVRLIGVLEVLNKRGSPFDERDITILIIVSNQIGIAMENARLYQRLQEKFILTADELKKMQQKLIQSERLASLGRLSHAIAHEVRNPVMSIGGFAKRCKQNFSPEHPNQKYLDIIIKETARLEKMVRDIENYTKVRLSEFRPINLKKLVEDVLEEWRQNRSGSDIEVHLELPGDEVSLPGDAWLLSLALKNLFLNAEEAMVNGGRLSFSARPQGKQIIFKIADTGSGIPSEDLPQIFDPFFASKPQGCGLGLTIVHRIVSEHKGEISVKSTPGEGTEFQISLPLYPDDIQLSELEGTRGNHKS
jgi:two-component system sensor histidine kinase HydH